MVSALGFGVAYYFDAENGAERRQQVRLALRRTANTIDSVLTPTAGDPPPVFYPLLRGLDGEGHRSEPIPRFKAS